MSEIKVNSIKGVGASAAAITVNNSDGTCALASGSKLDNCTTDGTTNLTIADGNLVVGTSGHGIDFSAVASGSGMTSELLADYEEGTFTPNWDAGGGVTFSHNHQRGFYTKIGNTVTFQLYLMAYASSISGGNEGNSVALQGLPYTVKNNDRYNPAFTIGRTYKLNISAAARIYAYGDANTTVIRFILQEDDQTGSLLTAGALDQNTCIVFVTGVYQI